jgi:hypothetical protein
MSDREDDEDSANGGSPQKGDTGLSKKRKEQPSPDARKTAKAKRVKGIDDEAQESSDDEEGGSSDEDSEEGDGTQYVEDDFLVRDDANSDEGSGEEESGSESGDDEKLQDKSLQRLKKRRHDVQLDEDDELLIRENEAARAGRAGVAENKSSKELNRSASDDREIAPEVRKRSATAGSDESGDEEGAAIAGRAGAPQQAPKHAAPRGYYDSDEEGSDMGGFIVDEDEEGEGAEGAEREPRRRPRAASADGPQVHSRRTGRREGPTYDQLQEAMDIFGAGFDDFSDEDELAAGRDSDSEGGEDGRVTTDKLRRMDLDRDGEALERMGDRIELNKKDQRRIQKLRSRYERAHLVATFCTEHDDVLRRVDRPERLQQVLVGRDTPDDSERLLEARWMAAKLASRMIADKHLDHARKTVPLTANPQAAYNSSLYSYGSDIDKEETLKAELEQPIGQVLRFLQVRDVSLSVVASSIVVDFDVRVFLTLRTIFRSPFLPLPLFSIRITTTHRSTSWRCPSSGATGATTCTPC